MSGRREAVPGGDIVPLDDSVKSLRLACLIISKSSDIVDKMRLCSSCSFLFNRGLIGVTILLARDFLLSRVDICAYEGTTIN